MSVRGWYLVAYDIRDDRRLRRVAKLLEGRGERLQYSLFRCRLSPRDIERLRLDLTRLTSPVDSWLVIPLCSGCIERMHRHNAPHAWPPDLPPHAVY
jgi:CRISPR-associated protein Cas2